jgi:hypothetical protein
MKWKRWPLAAALTTIVIAVVDQVQERRKALVR